jgi:phage shock protein A
MATLLEKVSTLISANLHSLVDQALKTNSLVVIDQYIRQVEDQLDDLTDAATTVGAEIKSIRRKLDDHTQKADELDRAADAFLGEGNESAALAAQTRLNSTLRLIETYKTQIATQEVEYQKLLDAKVKLEARLATMKQQRVELQSLLELAKSKEVVAKTVKSLDDLMGTGDSDVNRIAQSIYARLDKATAANEMQAANLDQQIDRVLERDAIQQQIEERKRKLAARQASG